jgi:GNAT superfamily N-acetyltransferase
MFALKFAGLILPLPNAAAIRLRQGSPPDYEVFKQFCYRLNYPFFPSDVYVTEPPAGVIVYTPPFRNNGMRFAACPELKHLSPAAYIRRLNQSFICLNRVIVLPDYRRQGIAAAIIAATIKLYAAKTIECITNTPAIERIIMKAGFKHAASNAPYNYYILPPPPDVAGASSNV